MMKLETHWFTLVFKDFDDIRTLILWIQLQLFVKFHREARLDFILNV